MKIIVTFAILAKFAGFQMTFFTILPVSKFLVWKALQTSHAAMNRFN